LLTAVVIGFVWRGMKDTAPASNYRSANDVHLPALSSTPDPSTTPGAEGGPPDPKAVKASEDAADAAASSAASR